ncbi:hypothetical protein SCLARK_00119 [Spiroplasma clarkii]|nr:hypothetical protein SCLARK_00119 [Spiroplasma clarkii]
MTDVTKYSVAVANSKIGKATFNDFLLPVAIMTMKIPQIINVQDKTEDKNTHLKTFLFIVTFKIKKVSWDEYSMTK